MNTGERPSPAILLAAALMLATGSEALATPAWEKMGGAQKVQPPARVRSNFNAGWRFILADAPGAERLDFDDSAWSVTGLPHSFSLPYFQSRAFPVGVGWYRKHFTLPPQGDARRRTLEFEAAFQDAEVFVNGVSVGRHRGGYTGFSVDITKAVKSGDNVVAVRLDNRWNPQLAPRAGEHVFSGGIYRDVWLVETNAVHVDWYGTRITTPELSEASGRVRAETEVRNDDRQAETVTVRSRVVDPEGRLVASLPDSRAVIAPGETRILTQLSPVIAKPRLWSPETPALYRVVSDVVVQGRVRDTYDSTFGFRWVEWTADKGFFLNGKHRYFLGANVHQDQAGWGDAVTNGAIERDVQMIKEAGFDFIRGSHYPHDPHFAQATDQTGLMFLSEAPFWGIGGFQENGQWASPAYPTNPADRPGFEASVKQQLAEMIRIHRNHPSVVAWSMGNETFFSAKDSMPEIRRFLKELVDLSHQLDPSRKAAIGGVQRGEIDGIGDIAAYNGDGAVLYIKPGFPSFVSEYGSQMIDRPGDYAPPWGDLEKAPGAVKGQPESWRFPWRSGEVVWAGFDHGSIAGRKFGSMGIIDYARLPKRSWYWYRNAYRGVAPPAWPVEGKPAALRLTSSASRIAKADGTDDVQLVVTVVDAQGRALSNSPPVELAIEAGPGELPTGRRIRFAPESDIPIRDGQAAIAMRSWQSGVSRVRATSPGLQDAVLDIATLEGPPFVAGVTPIVADRPYEESNEGRLAFDEAPDRVFGIDNPTAASSTASGHSSRMANDNAIGSWWEAAPDDKSPWLSISPEKVIQFRKVQLTFPQAGNYRFVLESARDDGGWDVLADQSASTDNAQTREIETRRLVGSTLRIRLMPPKGARPGIAEVRIVGGM